ncbi:hypothetical protein [Burkholderia sp. LMG 13014]|uniref:hypothetical protein n=1 Tax=Burkholderia sp. LMG 13014 TaxID=2709306 RepID=UPI0019661749|nr:hypothetical protein [Burkholderia sp. LMG 13014]
MERYSKEEAEKLGAFDETAVTEEEALAAEVLGSSGANGDADETPQNEEAKK